MYEIFVEDHFSAAHFLKGYNGACARVHGHNWQIEARIQCRKLNRLGMTVDFKEVKDAVRNILDRLDHQDLNATAEFGSINPTAENIAQFLFRALGKHLNTEDVRVSRVKVIESPGCGASYWEEPERLDRR